MSVPRKGRLPAWPLLTDEGGSVNSRFLSALFPSAAQAHEDRGLVVAPHLTRRTLGRRYFTRKARWLVAIPFGVAMEIRPDVASAGTCAST